MMRLLLSYGFALVSVAVSAAAKSLIETWTNPGPPLIFFVPAVTFSAWYGGACPGLFSVATSSVVCSYLFLPPLSKWMIDSPNDVVRLTLFVATGVLISLLMQRLHSAVRASGEAADLARLLQDQVQESQNRLQDLIDGIDNIIYVKNLNGQYVFVNKAFERLFRCTREEVAGKFTGLIHPPAVTRRLLAVDGEVLATGKAVASEDWIPHGDEIRLFATTKFPLRNQDGTAYAVGGHSIDITEQRAAQEALRDSEQRFRSLSSCSPVGIAMSSVEGLCTYANARSLEIFGMALEEALGMGWIKAIHPDDRRRVVDQWQSCVVNGQCFSMEYRVIRGNRSMRVVHGRSAPLTSNQGTPMGYVATLEDVTDWRLAEDELRRQRDFAEGLIEAEPVMVLVLDGDGLVVRANPYFERVTQRISAEFLKTDWFAGFVPESHRLAAREEFERVLRITGGQAFQCPIIIREGRQRDVDWTFRMLHESSGDGPYVLAVGHDLTDLREAQERSIQLERLATIGQMMASLAHESRNCLQRSQACLEMLSWRLSDQPDSLNLLHGIQQAQDELYRLFEDLRNHAAPIVLDCTEFSLHEALEEAWSQLEPARTGRQACLRVQGIAKPICKGDRLRITQVFRNILANALEACKHPVRIDVVWTAAELEGKPALGIAIQNTGPLLSLEQRQHFFDPFYTTKPRGTGLGIPIASRIVEAHGGRLELGPVGDERFTLLIRLPRG